MKATQWYWYESNRGPIGRRVYLRFTKASWALIQGKSSSIPRNSPANCFVAIRKINNCFSVKSRLIKHEAVIDFIHSVWHFKREILKGFLEIICPANIQRKPFQRYSEIHRYQSVQLSDWLKCIRGKTMLHLGCSRISLGLQVKPLENSFNCKCENCNFLDWIRQSQSNQCKSVGMCRYASYLRVRPPLHSSILSSRNASRERNERILNQNKWFRHLWLHSREHWAGKLEMKSKAGNHSWSRQMETQMNESTWGNRWNENVIMNLMKRRGNGDPGRNGISLIKTCFQLWFPKLRHVPRTLTLYHRAPRKQCTFKIKIYQQWPGPRCEHRRPKKSQQNR